MLFQITREGNTEKRNDARLKEYVTYNPPILDEIAEVH